MRCQLLKNLLVSVGYMLVPSKLGQQADGLPRAYQQAVESYRKGIGQNMLTLEAQILLCTATSQLPNFIVAKALFWYRTQHPRH
jgi:hypothetical protein